jgi:transcriptional regulator with XRE-family HTH domain
MKKKARKKPMEAEPELEKLSARIKQLRIAKGYSNLLLFAYDHHINPSQYARYERGHDIQYSTLIKLLNAFNISVAEFFGEGFD